MCCVIYAKRCDPAQEPAAIKSRVGDPANKQPWNNYHIKPTASRLKIGICKRSVFRLIHKYRPYKLCQETNRHRKPEKIINSLQIMSGQIKKNKSVLLHLCRLLWVNFKRLWDQELDNFRNIKTRPIDGAVKWGYVVKYSQLFFTNIYFRLLIIVVK